MGLARCRQSLFSIIGKESKFTKEHAVSSHTGNSFVHASDLPSEACLHFLVKP